MRADRGVLTGMMSLHLDDEALAAIMVEDARDYGVFEPNPGARYGVPDSPGLQDPALPWYKTTSK